jgi:hypothetical protein
MYRKAKNIRKRRFLKINIGDLVVVNKRARDSYNYTKPGSKGRVKQIGYDKGNGKETALVEFIKIKSDDDSISREKFPIYSNHLSILKDRQDGKILCKDCLNYHKESDLEKVGDKIVCKKCRLFYKQCHSCGKLENTKSIENITFKNKVNSTKKFYCNKCIKKLFTKCGYCGKYELKLEFKKFRTNKYCRDCFNKHFTRCKICDSIVKRSHTINYRRKGSICKGCWEKNYTIKNYSYTPPTLNFSKLDSETGNILYMGLELEVVTYDDRFKQAESVEKLTKYLDKLNINNLFYFKEDSSLGSDDEGHEAGFEIITHPFTLNYRHKKLNFHKLLSWLRKNRFVSYEGGRCGLHVHLSRSFFENQDIQKIRLFFSTNRDRIIRFSKRGITENLNNYAKPETYNINHYKDFYKNMYDSLEFKRPPRHSAINISSKNTIELRIFRGTLHYPRFLATLQFCHALAHFVKKYSVVVMQNGRSWQLFKDFIAKENRYEHLLKYLKRVKL